MSQRSTFARGVSLGSWIDAGITARPRRSGTKSKRCFLAERACQAALLWLTSFTFFALEVYRVRWNDIEAQAMKPYGVVPSFFRLTKTEDSEHPDSGW